MVYVSGVPFSAEWQELKDHMKQAGTVEFCSILDNGWGKSRGVGCVRYSTPEEAQNAIASLDGSTMTGKDGKGGDKILKVDEWTGPKPQTQKGGMAAAGGKGGGMGGIGQMMGALGGGGGGNGVWLS